MGYLYINFCKEYKDITPWVITETNFDRTVLIKQELASDLEINVFCKSFVGQFHYFYCEGEITWEGTKAVINAPTTFQHLPLV